MNREEEKVESRELPPDISPDVFLGLYRTMLRIRRFEERVADLVASNEITTPCHLYIGQEGVATGVCAATRREDWVFSTHRSHGHYIAKGGNITRLMAELFTKEGGCSGGMGGSMHVADPEIGLPGSSAIVAGTIPIAVGAGLAFSMAGKGKVAISFFGDGAVNEGVFYESLNIAALYKLPVLFVCENNGYSTHMPIAAILADTDICKKAEAMGVPATRVNGNCVTDVYKSAVNALESARNGDGPVFLECMTYRWRGHVGPSDDIDKGLRDRKELDHWIKRCPIRQLEEALTKRGILTECRKEEILASIDGDLENDLQYARDCPSPAARDVPPENEAFRG